MGKRGPRPDTAQAAKGNPGRRKAKAVQAVKEVELVSQLLAPVSGVADVPPMLQNAKYLPAAALWRRLAPELKRTHRLPIESEMQFVQLCIYAQEWADATEDLHTNGFTQSVSTVAGGTMERRRPKQFDRQQAFQNISDLSGKFGLAPSDMYALFKNQAQVAPTRPDLFGGARAPGAPVEPTPETPTRRIGGLAAMRSDPPPGRLPN